MLAHGKAVVLPLVLTAVFAGTAAAQASCEINEDKPSQIGRAFLSVTQAATQQEAGVWPGSAKALTAAVKVLGEGDVAKKNAAGHALLLGKALSLWLNHPENAGGMTTRAAVGFQDNGTASIDLVATVDSLFDSIESAQPGCAPMLNEWRRQRGWVGMLNGAIEHLNAGRLDSAETVAQRANRLSPSPYGFMVLGNVAQNRNNVGEALAMYQQTVDLAAKDSAFREVREQTLVTIGNLAADAAEDTAGAAKTELAKQSAAAYTALIQEAPASVVAPQARAGLGRALLLQGDTAAFRATLKEHLENPTKYPYQDVLASAVTAARAGQWKEGVVLFEGALQSNPWNRDALYNAALGYHELGQFEKMLPHVRKLVQVDPGNGENWRLFAYAYNGISKATKAPAAQRAMNDSVVKYFEMAEKMPHQVQFTEFSNTSARTTLAGTIENRGTAEQSYAMKIEFLDKDGNVVATREAAVASVAPKASGRFSVTVEDAPTAVAFRYAPLS
jgi:tetratricopeptide (TPR) repeat protein